MASSAVITIVASTHQGLRLIPALWTPSSRSYRDALREAFTPSGSDPSIAEAFDLAAASDEGIGFPIASAELLSPGKPGLNIADLAFELPELHDAITYMLDILTELTTDQGMDDVTLFIRYE